MSPNVGKFDRIFRALLGIAVIAIGLHYRSPWGAIGGVFLFTAFMSWCPLYVPFKINTGGKGACCQHDKQGA